MDFFGTYQKFQHLYYSSLAFLTILVNLDSSWTVLSGALTILISLSIILNTHSGIWPKLPHFGHGPAVFPERFIFEPYINIPDGKELLQLLQIAGIIGI